MGDILFKGRNGRRLLDRARFIRACLGGRRYAFTDHRGRVIYSVGSRTMSAGEWRRAYRAAAMERLDAACMVQRAGIDAKGAGLDYIRTLEAFHDALIPGGVDRLGRAGRLAPDSPLSRARYMLARLERRGIDLKAEQARRAKNSKDLTQAKL